jgi:hypothetical protein
MVRVLRGRHSKHADRLENPCHVHDRPVFDDLATADAADDVAGEGGDAPHRLERLLGRQMHRTADHVVPKRSVQEWSEET